MYGSFQERNGAVAGPTAVVPQYYQVQTPWGISPANLIQQGQQPMQQQQLLRSAQTGRPLTPSQQNDPLGTPNQQLQTGM